MMRVLLVSLIRCDLMVRLCVRRVHRYCPKRGCAINLLNKGRSRPIPEVASDVTISILYLLYSAVHRHQSFSSLSFTSGDHRMVTIVMMTISLRYDRQTWCFRSDVVQSSNNDKMTRVSLWHETLIQDYPQDSINPYYGQLDRHPNICRFKSQMAPLQIQITRMYANGQKICQSLLFAVCKYNCVITYGPIGRSADIYPTEGLIKEQPESAAMQKCTEK